MSNTAYTSDNTQGSPSIRPSFQRIPLEKLIHKTPQILRRLYLITLFTLCVILRTPLPLLHHYTRLPPSMRFNLRMLYRITLCNPADSALHESAIRLHENACRLRQPGGTHPLRGEMPPWARLHEAPISGERARVLRQRADNPAGANPRHWLHHGSHGWNPQRREKDSQRMQRQAKPSQGLKWMNQGEAVALSDLRYVKIWVSPFPPFQPHWMMAQRQVVASFLILFGLQNLSLMAISLSLSKCVFMCYICI